MDRLDWEGTVRNQLHYFLNTTFSKTLWITFPNSEDFFGESRTLSGIWTVSLLGIINLYTNQIKTLIAHLSQGFSLSNLFPQAWPLNPSPPVGQGNTVHALIVLVPPGPSIHSAAYGSSRVEQRACISVLVCVCVCVLNLKRKGILSLVLLLWCWVSLIAGAFFHDKDNLLALPYQGAF